MQRTLNANSTKQCLEHSAVVVLLMFLFSSTAFSQTVATTSSVPRLLNYAGIARDAGGKALHGVIGATFAIYADQEGGAALWIETQNITAGANGGFSVMLGASKPGGLPQELFSGGQGRWLGITFNGETEQSRIALLSVPYALKAADAETVGGLPPSAFVLAAPPSSSAGPVSPAAPSSALSVASPSVSGIGTADFVPLWLDSSGTLGNSVLFQSGIEATAKVGINTTSPASTLDVKGPGTVRGTFQLPSIGTATAAAGSNSNAFDLAASAFNSGTAKAANQIFQWQAEPSGNNTTAPSATLNLLFASGSTKPAETGLKLNSKGLFTFAAGQTFPGTGTITGVNTATGSGLTGGGAGGNLTLSLLTSCAKNQTLQWNGTAWACATAGGSGTITGVTAGTDLTGGGTTGTVTLNLDTTKVPQLSAANTFTGNQTVSGNFTSTGTVQGAQGFFSNSAGTVAVEAIQNDTTRVDNGIAGIVFSPQTNSAGVVGTALTTLSNARVFGVMGTAQDASGTGVFGIDGAVSKTGEDFSGVGVWGDAGTFGNVGVLATADDTFAMLAENDSPNDASLVGVNNSGSGLSLGVEGGTESTTGIGIYGVGFTGSNTFQTHSGFQPIGITGDAGDTPGAGTAVGVWGAADSGIGVIGETGGGIAGLFLNNTPLPATAFEAGGAVGSCTVDGFGSLTCTGPIGNAIQRSDSRWSQLYAVQSTESWFEDFGSGTLSNGNSEVALDPAFLETVNATDYHVFLTPNGDCRGLYIASKTPSGFVVRELGSGTSNVSFDYRIVARRKGFENVRLADVTESRTRSAATRAKLARVNNSAAKARRLGKLPLPAANRQADPEVRVSQPEPRLPIGQ